jgi:hypothetical protein
MAWNDAPAWVAGSSDFVMRSSVLVMHRCVPLRRQQAGRVDAASSNTPGAISEKPITASRTRVDARCTVPWYILPLYLGNRKRVRDMKVDASSIHLETRLNLKVS